MTLKTQWLGSFAWKAIVCTTKVRDETFRNGKRYEDKAVSPRPSPEVCRDLFLKKAYHGGTNFFGQTYGGYFTRGLMIRSCKGGGVSQMHFPVIWTL